MTCPLGRAAIVVPFYSDRLGELRLILIERTSGGRHGGQLALPGGRCELGDATMRDTAVREACEELGIAPEAVHILGELAPTRTRSTGLIVWPFVARLSPLPDRWCPQESEVASVVDLRVADVVDPDMAGYEEMHFAGWQGPRHVPVRWRGGRVLWGLTLRVLEPVLPAALAGGWDL
jgi:8-oxo-dGTP pyrophosphatase MutT (NUDIX family)